MKRKFLFFCLFIAFIRSFGNDTLNINNTTLSTPYPNKFTNAGSMAINEQLNIVFDSINSTYSTTVRDTAFSIIKPLHLKMLRFPGGTIGNFYHFYGKGYGIDTSETNCAPGRIGYGYPNQSLNFDRKVDKNIIEYFKQEIDILKANGDNVAVAFRLNSHTHFYKGDLKKYSDSIQYLIERYFNYNTAFLNSNGGIIDSNNLNLFIGILYQIQNDAVVKRIKKELINNPGFYYRFKENFDALEYLKINNIAVAGIEIGNETESELIIYDDDLSFIGRDCTDTTSVISFPAYLPVRYYFEGLIKNWILVSLYADSIKMRYNLPVGVPAIMSKNVLIVDNNLEPVFVNPYLLHQKFADIWNKYYGSQPLVQALIPHVYTQNYLSCNDYAGLDTIPNLNLFTVNKLSEKFFKAYIDTVIMYNLNRIYNYGNKKPLWVTEWNYTSGNYATNTFLHAIYNYYFIRKAVELHESNPNFVQNWMYHFLIGGNYSYPLIRTEIDSFKQFHIEKQITYEPFYIWSNTMNQQVKRIKTPFWQKTESSLIDAFINAGKNEIYIQYVNSDSANQYLSLQNLHIVNNAQELNAYKIDRYILDAASFTSTNYTECSIISNDMNSNSYEIINDTLSNIDSFLLPSLSMGKFTLYLKNKVAASVNIEKTTKTQIFPNPTCNSLNIMLKEFNSFSEFSYIVYNSLGSIVLQGNMERQRNNIDVSGISDGMYFIQIKENTQTIDSHKFIKN